MTKGEVLYVLFRLVEVLFTMLAILYFPFCALLYARGIQKWQRRTNDWTETLMTAVILTFIGLMIVGYIWWVSLPDAKAMQ